MMSSVVVNIVDAFAPVRHGWSYGTSSPQIVRFFTPGRLYVIDSSVTPMVWLTFALGLMDGRTRSACAIDDMTSPAATSVARVRRNIIGAPPGECGVRESGSAARTLFDGRGA